MRVLLPCLVFLSLMPPPASAQEFLPAPELAARSINDHPLVARAEAALRAATADARRLAAGDHEFVAAAGYTRRDIEGDRRYDEWEGSISRAFRLPGKAGLDRRAGVLGITAQENALDDARHQTALKLADVWMAWVGAEAHAHLDAEDVRAWEQEQAAMARRVALRDAAPLDLDRIGAGLALARTAAVRSAGQAHVARMALTREFPGLSLPKDAPRPKDPALPERGLSAWFDVIVARSHELHFAEAEAERQAVLARRQALDRWADPSVGVRVFSERGGAENGVGLFLSVPLGGPHRRALADRALTEASAAVVDLEMTRREIEGVAERDIAEVESSFSAWQHARQALDAGERAFVRTRRGYALGDIDLADLLTLRRQQQELARAELQARIDANVALLKLRIDAHELWLQPHKDHPDEQM